MFTFLKRQGNIVLAKDPSMTSLKEAILTTPSIKAQAYHRIAHYFYQKKKPFLAKLFASHARKVTGIEIHPGAVIGEDLFIDHGMGVVIGETARIGKNVTIFHQVTLGGIGGAAGEKRHPTIEDDVLIGAGAQILGDITIGRGAKIGANAVVLHDIPPYSTAVGIPAKVVNKQTPAYMYVI